MGGAGLLQSLELQGRPPATYLLSLQPSPPGRSSSSAEVIPGGPRCGCSSG